MFTPPAFRGAARLLALGLIGFLGASGAGAQSDGDSRNGLRILVPFGPGTPLDVFARDIAQELRGVLNQQILVENKPGAAGMIGGAELARTPATTTTFMLTTHNTVVINPHLYRNISYDPLKDFAPVGLVGVGGYVLVAPPASPFKTLAQYLAAARAEPGKISFASLGTGSGPHLCGEMLMAQAKVKLVHVPYTTGSITNVVGGQVDSSWEPYATAAPFLKSGKLSALGASTKYRPAIFPPGVPLLPEAVPGYECTSWIGLFASARTPEATVRRMADALARVVQTPAFQERLNTNGFLAKPGSPKELHDLIDADYRTWGKVIQDASLKLQ